MGTFGIFLSVVCIIYGIVGLIRQHESRKRKRKKILALLVANFIIAKDAMIRANLEPKELTDGLEHLIDNTLNIVIDACGTKYVEEADWMLYGYEIKKEE